MEVKSLFYIKLEEDMKLVITVREPIYRGDNLNQNIIYLIPTTVGDIDIASSRLYLNCVFSDGIPEITELERMDSMYNESYYQYTLPVTCNLTRIEGNVCTWIDFRTGPSDDQIISKSGECILNILPSKDIDDYVDDSTMFTLYQVQTDLGDHIKHAGEEIDSIQETLESIGNHNQCGSDSVSYTEQELTPDQQAQARKNIDAASTGDIPKMDIVESGNGYRIYINDANGMKSAYIQSGESGETVIAKYGSTTYDDIDDAMDNGKPVCVLMPSGQVLWLKGDEQNGSLEGKRFSDSIGHVAVSEAASFSSPSSVHVQGQYFKCTSNDMTPGDYMFKAHVGVGVSTGSNVMGPDDGLYILPVNDTTNPKVGVDPVTGRRLKYKVRLHKDGLQFIYSSVSNGAYNGLIAEVPELSISNGSSYYLKIAKTDGSLYIKMWPDYDDEPTSWTYVYADISLNNTSDDGTRYENGFEFHWTGKKFLNPIDFSNLQFVSLDGIPFEWFDMLYTIENMRDTRGLLSLDGLSTMKCIRYEDGHVELSMGETGSSITTSKWISGDYTTQFDVEFKGASVDAQSTDRDEGLNVFPLYQSNNKNIGTKNGYVYQHRIRLSPTHGVSLHYGTNSVGDYGDTLFGKEGSVGSAINKGDHSLPETFALGEKYTVKIKKDGDSLFLKAWNKEKEAEPGWQCEYHDNTIGDSAGTFGVDSKHIFDKWKLRMQYTNKCKEGADYETVTISNLSVIGYESQFWQDSFSSKALARSNYKFSGCYWSEYTEGLELNDTLTGKRYLVCVKDGKLDLVSI